MSPQREVSVRGADPGDVTIRPRDIVFDWSETPLHWIPGQPVASNTFNAVHLLLPEVERWFCDVYQEALPLVKDAELAEKMRGFIGQEAIHASAHDAATSEFLEAKGIDTAPYVRQVEYLFRKVFAARPGRTDRSARNDLVQRVWLIAAAEHYTALVGDFILNSRWDEYEADPVMADLLRWHGAEEVEHRCVAHEVATYFDDSYLHRCRAMLFALVVLVTLGVRTVRFIEYSDPKGVGGPLRLFFGYLIESHRGLVPKLRGLGSATVAYFRPGFDPRSVGSTAQAVAYLASSPAVRTAGHSNHDGTV